MVEEGWSYSDAEAFCTQYGLNIEKIEQETTAVNEGIIIAQNMPKGRTIVKGMTLRVTVAIKPKPKPTPTPTPSEDDKDKEKDKDKEEDKTDDNKTE